MLGVGTSVPAPRLMVLAREAGDAVLAGLAQIDRWIWIVASGAAM